jgi:putative transposase
MLCSRRLHQSRWGKKFGKTFSDQICQRAPARGDKWHRDEVVVPIAGERHWLWRAVDQNDFVLDVLVQRRRDSRAAQRLMRKLLKSAATPPRVMITDKLRSYGAARAKMGLRVEHRQHKRLNNRAENSRQPTRRRERIMKRFKLARQGQRFLSVHDQVANLFHIPYPESVTADLPALGASKPSPSGARLRRSLPRSEESPLVLAGLSASRFSPLKLTVPHKGLGGGACGHGRDAGSGGHRMPSPAKLYDPICRCLSPRTDSKSGGGGGVLAWAHPNGADQCAHVKNDPRNGEVHCARFCRAKCLFRRAQRNLILDPRVCRGLVRL